MRISKKLPLAAAVFAFVAISAATTISLVLEARSLDSQVYQRLEAAADGRRNEARVYLDAVRLDLAATAGNVTTQQALVGFQTTWKFLGDDPVAEAQQRYIDANPNPEGKKYLLDTAKKDNFDRTHKQYNEFFREHLLARGYYDIFIIDPDGNIVYTVMKERDYATNLKSGPYKSTGLGQVFSKALASTARGEIFIRNSNPMVRQAATPRFSWQRRSPSVTGRRASLPISCRTTGSTRSFPTPADWARPGRRCWSAPRARSSMTARAHQRMMR